MGVCHVEGPFSLGTLLNGRASNDSVDAQESTCYVESNRQTVQKGDLKMHAAALCACTMPELRTRTSYPELREGHDLSKEEQKIRQALQAYFPTVEEAAEALGLDQAQFIVDSSSE